MPVQLLAILVTDLVGSTANRVEVGEDRAEQLRREHDAMVRSVVEAAEGTVVKGTGDGALAWFPNAADAVAAAIGVQRRLDGLRIALPDGTWAMRVGISVGDVTVESDGDVFGAPVVEASRLCAAAEPGEILAVDLVKTMARGRVGDVFVPKGELVLKGLPEPVPVCSVGWDIRSEAFALPVLLGARSDTAFVGRDVEFAVLSRAWDDALNGRLTVAFVSGEPGIGKTRLVSDFARARHREGALVLASRCDEELGAPFAPFSDALAHLVTQTPERELRGQLGASAGLVARIVPGLAALAEPDDAPRADAEIERAQFVDAVIRWLGAVATSAPAVLILDDLHWADGPSLSLLRALARDPRSARVLVLGTYREIELARTHPLSAVLAELRRSDAVIRLSLDGLPEGAVATLIDLVGDDGLVPDDPGVAAALCDATGGNPFFVLEMVRHLNENEWRVGGTPARADGAAGRFALPEGVREVIGQRLSRLSDETNELLRVAAVIGRTFDVDLVSRVTDVRDDDIVDLLVPALDARLVAEVNGVIDRFEFTHALIQETLRTEVPTSQRVRLHRRIARAIEEAAGADVTPHLGALAYHFGEAASSGSVDEAVAYARRAAEHAMATLAFEDAVVYLDQALTASRLRDDLDSVEQAALCQALAEAHFALRDADRAETAARAAIDAARAAGAAAGAVRAQAAILLWELRTYSMMIHVDDVVELLREALAGLDESMVAERIELLDALALHGIPMDDLGGGPDAVTLARSTNDRRLLADALCAYAMAHPGPRYRAERDAAATELAALEITDHRGPMLTWGGAFVVPAANALRRGDMAHLRALTEGVKAASTRSANPEMRYHPIVWESLGLALAGRWSDAEARALDAVAVLTGFDETFAMTQLFIQLVPIRRAQDRLVELEGPLAELVATQPRNAGVFECALAHLHEELGKADEAHHRLARIVDDMPEVFDREDANWFVGMQQLGDACASLGDEARAQVLYEQTSDVTNINVVVGGAGCEGAFDRVLGRLAGLIGRFDDADAHFATARARDERLESPPLVARTDVHHAEVLLRAGRPGDVERAQRLLDGAYATATRLEMVSLKRAIEELRPTASP